MDVAGVSLWELGARVRSAPSDGSLRRLAEALRGDPRAGAQALGQRCQRILEARRTERRRLAGLFARRAQLCRSGARYVAGVDEVGIGPLAGPVVAAAVIVGDGAELPGLDDSKRLRPQARQQLAVAIRERAVGIGLGVVEVGEIDRWNVYRAGLEAMRRAVCALPIAPDHVLVDGRVIPGLDAAQTRIVGGDRRDGCIAAASIVAKVHRDALMTRLDRHYPGYDFARHKGYATHAHLEALRRLGPSPVHRRSFAPVAQLQLL